MKTETFNRLNKYVEKTSKPFSRITNSIKEIENMKNAKLGGKEWQEKNNKRGFYPKHPAIKSVERKAKSYAKALEKKKK